MTNASKDRAALRRLNELGIHRVSVQASLIIDAALAAPDPVAELVEQLNAIRAVLAGPDYASLPNDYLTLKMAEERMAERDKFRWQVIDTCARAEKAEKALEFYAWNGAYVASDGKCQVLRDRGDIARAALAKVAS